MDESFRLVPESASNIAGPYDALFISLTIMTAVITLGIALTILWFIIRYRRRDDDAVGKDIGEHPALEITWAVIPLLICVGIFIWGTTLYFKMSRAPDDAMVIQVVGKQWMWKVQHPNGRKEINELHVPLGVPVKLQMTSEDVIHSFYVPAFRIKQDVLPGRYSQQWFVATKLGEYHLFCAEYCGTSHALMGGQVVVMEPGAYAAWAANAALDDRPEAAGARLFAEYGCLNCHGQQAPTLAGVYGHEQVMQDGRRIMADENYLRESILEPPSQNRRRLCPHHAQLQRPAFRGTNLPASFLHQIPGISGTRDQPGNSARCCAAVSTARALAGGSPMTIIERSLPVPAPELRRRPSYLQEGTTLRSWLLTTDHKRIGLLYLITITFFFAVGGAAASLIRLELMTPEADLLKADSYNRVFTMHGVIMVWFFLIPSIPSVLGNFLIPMMIGARDMAFPRLNLLSWYLFTLGGIFTFPGPACWAAWIPAGPFTRRFPPNIPIRMSSLWWSESSSPAFPPFLPV